MPWQPDYITGAELAAFVRAPTDDAYVAGLATAASRAVDGACHRQFGQLDDPAELVIPTSSAIWLPKRRAWLVRTEDLQDTTGLTVELDGGALDAGAEGYRLWPLNAAMTGKPYTGLLLASTVSLQHDGELSATARWGWTAVPAAAISAAYMQGNRWHVRRASPYGTAGSAQDGSQTSLTARLDPDVRGILAAAELIRLERPQ